MEIYGLDSFEQIGRITTATRVELIERDLGEGAWLIELPLGEAGDIGAGLLAGTWPGVELYDPDTGWRFGGYLTDWTVLVDQDGIETLQLIGNDFQSDLAAYLEWPDSELAENWWMGTVGGTVQRTTDLHNTVANNAGPGASASARPPIPGLTFGVDPAGGAPLPRRLKGEPLLTVARSLLWGTSWTARLHLVRAITNGAPSMLFETPARPLASIVLAVKRGTLGRMSYTTSAAAVTDCVGMGYEIDPDLSPGERLVLRNYGFQADWRERHRESFINRPAADGLEALAADVNEAVEGPDGAWSRAAKVDSARVDGYGRDVDLGWLVDVDLGPVFSPSTVRLPVVASSLEFTPATGWVRTIDVGVESLSGPPAILARIARERARIRQIENDIR